ncbi:site-specific integrase [Actinomyces sp. 594]|uniref:tyrosine-type recombinase/integrase n=1 Tax=Actinomyces sp. 594 TaxID=2057793 RepID=UPI001C59CF83|nr:site-specific integrase [Actinomyces sp. 594]MBW3068991.1 site-specific integrase [Actinomyces sp. 594]
MPQHRIPVGSWGKVSITPRGKAWQASTYVRDADGVRRRVRAQAATKAAARQALARQLAGRTRPPTGLMGASTTVDQLLEAWLERIRTLGRVRPQSADNYQRVVARIVSPALGAWLIGEVTPAAVQALILDTTPGQRRVVRTILSQAFSYARLDGATANDPVSDTVVPAPEERREPEVLTAEQVRRLREAVRDWGTSRQHGPRVTTTLACGVDLMLGTGVRIGEACALTWDDVDLEAGTIRVEGTFIDGAADRRGVQEAPKTDRARRTLYLPDFVVVSLVEHGPRDEGPVLYTRNGTHMSPANLRRSLRAAVREAGLDFEVTPHTLRRTLATFLARELGTREAADQLGHTDPAVTLAHYIAPEHRGPDARAAISGFVDG